MIVQQSHNHAAPLDSPRGRPLRYDGTAQALAAVGAPTAVGAARIVVGGALLAGLGLARGEFRGLARSWPTVAACSVGIAAYQLSFFVAVRETGVAVGTVVAIGAAAVVTGGLEWLVEGTRPGRRWAVATGLAVAGLVLLAFTSSAGARVSPVGLALGLASAAGYASYAVLSKRLLRLGHSPAGVMGSSFGFAGVLLLPVLALAGTSWLAEPRGIGLVVYLAVGPTAVAYLLYAYGLRRVTASETTTIGLAEPLVAAGARHGRAPRAPRRRGAGRRRPDPRVAARAHGAGAPRPAVAGSSLET